MAKQPSLFDQAKDWWQTDTAKAVATVIAVLLIPLAVIAWNYASNSKSEVEEATQEEAKEIVLNVEKTADVDVDVNVTPELNVEGKEETNTGGVKIEVPTTETTETTAPEETQEATPEENTETAETTETAEATEATETTEEPAPTEKSTDENDRSTAKTVVRLALFTKVLQEIRDIFAPANDEVANTEETDSAQVESDGSTETAQEPSSESTATTEGSAPADTTAQATTPTENALGGLQALPLTSSSVKYVVQKGDNVYKISMSVCENQSFYINNLRKDYLKVGQTIDVECD